MNKFNEFLNRPDVIDALKQNDLDFVYNLIKLTYTDNYFQVGSSVSDIFKDTGIDYLKYVKHLDLGMLTTYNNEHFDYSKYTNITEISSFGFEDMYFGEDEDVILPKSIEYIRRQSFEGSIVKNLRIYTDKLIEIGHGALILNSGKVIIDDKIEFEPYPYSSALTVRVANYFKKKHIAYY